MDKNIKREPALRFPGYTEEWKEEKLGNLILDDKISIQQSGIEKFIGKKKYIATADVSRDKIISFENIDYENKPSRANVEPKSNTIYFAKMAETIKSIVVENEDDFKKYIFSTGFMGINLLKDVNINFFKAIYDSYYFQYYKNLYSNGTTQVAINNKSIKLIKLWMSSYPEQEKIGSLFKTLDNKIEKQTDYIQKLKDTKKGLMQDIFSQKIRLKDENGKAFDGEWVEEKIENLILDDKISIQQSGVEKFIGEKRYIATADVSREKIISFENIDYKNKPSRANVEPKSNTIYFAKMAKTIKSILVKNKEDFKEYIFSTGFMGIQMLEDIDLYFFKALYDSYYFQYYKDLYSNGTTQVAINNKSVQLIKLLIPSFPEQKKIGQLFKTFDEKIEKEEELLEEYKNLKKGLLQDMFV